MRDFRFSCNVFAIRSRAQCERRDRFGYSYVTVHEPYMADLAPAIAKLR